MEVGFHSGASREILGPYTFQKSGPPLVLAWLPAKIIAHIVFWWITFQSLYILFEEENPSVNGKCHASAASKVARLSNILRVTRLELWLWTMNQWFDIIPNSQVYIVEPIFETLVTPRGPLIRVKWSNLACLLLVSTWKVQAEAIKKCLNGPYHDSLSFIINHLKRTKNLFELRWQ